MTKKYELIKRQKKVQSPFNSEVSVTSFFYQVKYHYYVLNQKLIKLLSLMFKERQMNIQQIH